MRALPPAWASPARRRRGRGRPRPRPRATTDGARRRGRLSSPAGAPAGDRVGGRRAAALRWRRDCRRPPRSPRRCRAARPGGAGRRDRAPVAGSGRARRRAPRRWAVGRRRPPLGQRRGPGRAWLWRALAGRAVTPHAHLAHGAARAAYVPRERRGPAAGSGVRGGGERAPRAGGGGGCPGHGRWTRWGRRAVGRWTRWAYPCWRGARGARPLNAWRGRRARARAYACGRGARVVRRRRAAGRAASGRGGGGRVPWRAFARGVRGPDPAVCVEWGCGA